MARASQFAKLNRRPNSPSPPEPLQGVRPSSRLLSQVRVMPNLSPDVGAPWRGPWRHQGELVTHDDRSDRDMLTRIRNGSMARHDRIEMPHSKLKEHVASVMKSEGYLDDVRVSEGEEFKTLTLVLRYGRDRQSAIDGVKRISTRVAVSMSDTTVLIACAPAWGYPYSAQAVV